MYIFKNAEVEKDFFMSSSLICNIIEFDANYGKNCVMLFGKLKHLFGEPLRQTDSVEEQYNYFIEAVDEAGNSLILEVYSGASGPAIGGLDDNASKVAANELVAYLEKTQEVDDYEYEGYYFDGPSKVKEGIKNGEPYKEEVEISMEEADEAFQKMMNK